MNNISFPVLETERLLLRGLKETDAQEIFLLRSDEKHNEFVDRPRATSIEDAKMFINKIEEFVQNKQSYFWAIQLKEEQTLAGTVTLWNLDPENNKGELGYELLSNYQGKGIMNEAAAAVLKFAFTELGLTRIEASPVPANKKSTGLLDRLGFKLDAEAEISKSSDTPEVIYCLAVEDYL
jgi:ribosomal-protein-alanine N-acetyltransferase